MPRQPTPFERLREVAEQKQRERSGLAPVRPADFPSLPVDPSLASNTPLASKEGGFASKFASKSEKLAGKSASGTLPANDALLANDDLANTNLPANTRTYPSWQVPKVTVRIPNELQDALRFIGLSKGLSFQDAVLLAIHGLLASEGLPANGGLPANAICQSTDQMIDDVAGISASSVKERPEELLSYYAKWTDNPIRESDWKALRAVFGYSPTAIKAGILMSILRTKTKVNSFKYCLGAIEEVAKAGIVSSADHVRYLEMKVEKAREGK